ncbi:MAG: hypothetical protein U1D55_03315 [Phycisphaerae bacterium]
MRLLIDGWRAWHTRSLLARSATKLSLFVVVILGVLYPRPDRFVTWFQRIRNLNSVIDPSHPGLAPLERAVRARIGAGASAPDVLAIVQDVVYRAIPYAWDWDLWGVMDYVPTVDETLRAGREDCDGRAVVAASLLRRMGYKATIASDLLHVWVVTPQGETMSPGKGPRSLVGTPGGTSVGPGVIANLSRGTAFGVSVFPLPREIIILFAICALTLQPRASIRRRAFGCLALIAALAVLRFAGEAAGRNGGAAWRGVAVGVGLAACGWLALALKARVARPRFDAARRGSPATDVESRC